MDATQAAFSPLRFSTASLPERHRVAAWRDFFGPKLFGGEAVPVSGEPFRCDLKLRVLPGLNLVSSVTSSARFSRSRAFLADGRDDFGLHINFAGGAMSQRGREIVCGAGEAVFITVAEPGVTVAPSNSRFVCLHISRAMLAPLVANADDAVLRRIAPQAETLRYLLGYVRFLEEADVTPALAETAATHLRDLLALAIGATRDAALVARRRGLRAARLGAIKRFIADNLREHRLGVDTVAARHGISPRSVQRLFEEEGTTFTEYVLGQRLDLAYRSLTDSRHARRTVLEVALETGFGDLSYFNRCFRRRYGASPTWFRS